MVVFFIITVILTFEQDSSLFSLDSFYSKYQATLIDTALYDSFFVPTIPDSQWAARKGLRLSGAKDFSFDMNEGFNQGLNVEIAGEIEGISLEGTISDRASPSSTVQLSDVEKISLTASTRHWYGGVGNLSLALPFNIQDEIQGGRIGFHTADSTSILGVAYAMNRGELRHLRLQGEEGRQSPYFLAGPVVSGSEKVFLAQGITSPELLTRDTDYLIDYEKGVLSFTNSRIITNTTRIEVHYQQTTEAYPDVYAESDGATAFRGIAITGLYRRRADDEHHPLSFTLSTAEIDSLRQAGDSVRVVHTYADTSAEGSYVLQDNHYVYVGPGNGDYEVTFFYVGEDNGEYIYDPLIKGFSYQGLESGNYSPTRPLPLPRSDEFGALNISFFNTMMIELYGSRFDRNTFSPYDDQDNVGYGYHLTAKKAFKIFNVNGDYVHYDESFLGAPRTQHIDYQYQYNTQDTLREMASISAGLTPLADFTLQGGYGILNKRYKRHFMTVRPLFFELGYEAADTLIKYFIGADLSFNKIALKARYEKVRRDHLFQYRALYNFSRNGNVGISGSYDYTANNRGITTVGSVVTFPLSCALGHRLYRDTLTIFGNARVQLRFRNISILGSIEQNQSYAQKKDENYLLVDEGTGNYVYDPVTGMYLERDGGNYIRKIFLLPEYERVVQRNYTIETGYYSSALNLIGKTYYVEEDDFLSMRTEVIGSIGQENYYLDAHIQQDLTEDRRYALYAISQRTRSFLLAPSFHRLLGSVRINESLEQQDDRLLLQRRNYGGDIGYRITTMPLVRPLLGYTYSTLRSHFFENLPLVLHAPKGNILIGFPFVDKGRIELLGELIYRIYNSASVPYYYAALDPPGLTRVVTATSSIDIGTSTLFSLHYRIEFPPVDRLRQNLRLQTRIRF